VCNAWAYYAQDQRPKGPGPFLIIICIVSCVVESEIVYLAVVVGARGMSIMRRSKVIIGVCARVLVTYL